MAEKKKKPKAATNRKAPSRKASAKIRDDKKPVSRGNLEGFCTVGMGASAGGLEAFEAVFRNMPENPGMAFVVVPHLDPSHISILPQLVQKCTRMQVMQIEDGLKILPKGQP